MTTLSITNKAFDIRYAFEDEQDSSTGYKNSAPARGCGRRRTGDSLLVRPPLPVAHGFVEAVAVASAGCSRRNVSSCR
jgi:hypothetical protein